MAGYNKKEIENELKFLLEELTKKFPKELLSYIHDFGIITGGSIVSLLLGEDINDIDIFFSDVDICFDIAKSFNNTLFKNEYHIEVFHQSKQIPWTHNGNNLNVNQGNIVFAKLEKTNPLSFSKMQKEPQLDYYGKNYKNVTTNPDNHWISTNAINLCGGKYQIITKHCGSPMFLTENFDFIHCVSYFSYKTGLVLNKFALEAILAKELRYIGSNHPISSFIRMNKFLKKGWRISNSEIIKICYDVSKLVLDDKDVLTNQIENHGLTYMLETLKEGYDRNDLFSTLNNFI